MSKIRLSKSVVGNIEKDALARVIDEGYLGMGRFVEEFEARLKDYLGLDHVVCVNSGTAALHLALMSLGLKAGSEVLVQSLTYIASFQAITAAGLKPVACEVVPGSCTIDIKDAGKKITELTGAIMPVHYGSRVGDLDGIYEFAKKYGIRVVEDAAHAFGTTYKGGLVGSFGDAICFSFDGIKNITSGEGGAVVTNDDAVAEYVKDARLLGVHKDTEKRYKGLRSWEFEVICQGYRFHMSNLFAAIGITQLGRFENEFMPKRRIIAKKYHKELSGIQDLALFEDDYDQIVPHIFPIKVLNDKRNSLMRHLIDNNIECGIHYYPNHLLKFYGSRRGELPVTENIYKQLLTLPIHPDLTDDQQTKIIKCVKELLH